MKKFLITATTVSMLAVGLAGCAPGQNTPGSTAVGALAGGLIGGALFHGRGNVAGILASSLIGGSIGYLVGRQMDQQDRINMANAIVDTPVNQQATWVNTSTNTTYIVRPVRDFHTDSGQYCREYRTKIQVGNEWKSAYGTACQQPDGQWQIQS